MDLPLATLLSSKFQFNFLSVRTASNNSIYSIIKLQLKVIFTHDSSETARHDRSNKHFLTLPLIRENILSTNSPLLSDQATYVDQKYTSRAILTLCME